MGITAGPSYTTTEGFVVSPIYLHVTTLTVMSGNPRPTSQPKQVNS